jgi:hypothetical protein
LINVSIVGLFTDGSEQHFHLDYDALSRDDRRTLDHSKKLGKIKKGFLDKLFTMKGYFHSLIEDEYELEVIE